MAFLCLQADNSTSQYVYKMMVDQHRFFQTEYQGLDVKWIANAQRYAHVILMQTVMPTY